MKTFGKFLMLLSILNTLTSAGVAQDHPAELQITDGPMRVHVLLQGPAHTETELQIVCLFKSDPSNGIHGSLTELNDKLNGLLLRIRTPALFRGELGETILIAPDAETIAAKKLMIIGLGDSQTFTPDRMELVGSIVYREAARLHVAHPFFAPTVLDGGISKFSTGQISEEVIKGVLRAIATEKALKRASDSVASLPQDLTYLAGTKYASNTKDGIERSFAAAK